MAMTYQNFASLGVNLNRQKYGPLDISNVFTSAADLKYYLTKGAFTEGVSTYWYKNANEKIVPYPYEGQVLATVIDGDVKVYVLQLDAEGAFEAKAIEPEVDGMTIKLTDGKLELVGLPTNVSGKTYVPSLVNGVLTWAEPDTSTAEGQQQAIDGLAARATALELTVNGKPESGEGTGDAVVGLVDKVAALEAVDNATQAELDAYKEVVTAAIAAGVKEAKDYADEHDADTQYDDTAVKGRLDVIERDYLKEADKYDDTEVRGLIGNLNTVIGDENTGLVKDIADNTTAIATEQSRAEAAEKALGDRIDAIDFVDTDELAEAIKDFATDKELEDALALKADKTALEDLKSTVDAFLTGEGTEAALDSLKELVAYIETHDDVDIAGILEDIQTIENKLVGIDSTVVDYVTAAIEALKIGDYAKASDLATLAGRVEALEGKPFDSYATKTEVESVDGKFAEYTKTTDLNSLLAAKADADKVVSNEAFNQFKVDNTAAIEAAQTAAVAAAKTETETQVGALEDSVAETYATKEALETHASEIANELLAYAKTADVTVELAKKIETGSIAHSTEELAEGVTVNGTELAIVVDAFTKAETRKYVADTITSFTGGESAKDVLLALNNHIAEYEEKVGQLEAKDASQDTDIAAAMAKAEQGVADAAKVASDLVTANNLIADNAREIGVAKSSIETVNTTLSGKITALEGKDTEFTTAITALETTVGGHTTTITEHGTALAALQNKDIELAALIQGNTNKFADYYTSTQVDAKVQEAIDAIPDVDFTPYAKTEDVNAALLLKANAADVYTKDEADLAFMTEAEVDARINTLIAAADPENDGKVITNIENLVEYVENNAGDIAALITNVNTHGETLESHTASIAALSESLAAVVQPKASEEITVASDGTLGLGKVSTDKLELGENTLVLDGGSAAV